MDLTQNDISNLRKLLDRVSTNGVQEAMVLAVLAQKLDAAIAEAQDGEDLSSTD